MAERFAFPPEASDSSSVSSEQNEIIQPLSEQGTLNGENLTAMEGVTVSESLNSTVTAWKHLVVLRLEINSHRRNTSH